MGSLGAEATQNATQLSGVDAWMDGGGHLHWGGQQEGKTRLGGGVQEGERKS